MPARIRQARSDGAWPVYCPAWFRSPPSSSRRTRRTSCRDALRERRLLRRDRGRGLGLDATARATWPRRAGRAGDRERALARLRGPAQLRGRRGRATTGCSPSTPTSGSRPRCARRSRACAPRGFDCAGYRIPRVAFYLGRWIRATDWYPDPQVRLFDRTPRRAGRASSSTSRCACAGRVGRLRARHGAPSLRRHQRPPAQDRPLHDALGAAGHAGGAPHRRTSTCVIAADWAFLRNYVLKRGFLLGRAGLTVSALNSYYTYVKLAKLDELARTAARPPRVRILHVDTAREPGAAGRTRCCSRPWAWRARGHEVDAGLPGRRRARSRRARAAGLRGAARPASGATSGRLAILALRARSARRPGPRSCSSTIPHAVSAGLVARRLARPRRSWSPRAAWTFALRGRPLALQVPRRCDRVIAVSRAIARRARGPTGLPRVALRLVLRRRPRSRARRRGPRGPRARWACPRARPWSATWPR